MVMNQFSTSDQTIYLSEIFESIQGESSFQGLWCTFVRTSGCNLRCSYCDSTYTFSKGTPYSIRSILEQIENYQNDLVEITGGEPLLQNPVNDLMSILLEKKKTVLLETSGSLDIGKVPDGVKIILDLKCPSSGESSKNLMSNLDFLDADDEVKFVLSHKEDFDWVLQTIRNHSVLQKNIRLLLSPVHNILSSAQLVDWWKMHKKQIPNARLNMQIHKYVWPNIERGI